MVRHIGQPASSRAARMPSVNCIKESSSAILKMILYVDLHMMGK